MLSRTLPKDPTSHRVENSLWGAKGIGGPGGRLLEASRQEMWGPELDAHILALRVKLCLAFVCWWKSEVLSTKHMV